MNHIFVRLEVDFADDKDITKLSRYGRDARGCRDLLVQMWCHCKQHLTDGHVTSEAVGKLVYPDPPRNGVRDAERLVAVGVAEKTDTGYYLPGFLKRNKSRAQVEDESRKRAASGRRGGLKSGEVRRGDEANGKQSASIVEGLDEALCFNSVEHRVQSTENRVQSSENNSYLLRGEGSSSVAVATKAPTLNIGCSKHDNPYDDDPCGQCKRWRLALETEERADELAGKRAKAEATKVRETCQRCAGSGWVLDTDPAVRCAHKVSAS